MTAPEKPHAVSTPLLFGAAQMSFHPQVVLIAMVLMLGCLGALVGGRRRFLYFATRDELTERDEWSYIIRPAAGRGACAIYFTLRGGYLGQDQTAPDNPYGVGCAVSARRPLHAPRREQAADVFDTLFGEPKEDAAPVDVKVDDHERLAH